MQLNDLPDLPDARNQQNQVELPGNRNWTALETLAEVSRQIDLSEKHDDRTVQNTSAGSQRQNQESQRFELQEQWTPDNPPLSYEARVQRDKKSKKPPNCKGMSNLFSSESENGSKARQ